ncbi:aminotransferase-like domain-containing protein [Cellulosimicrobium cellulans]|uniref:aminotransferase-like domain-containing protein n=1 Tax=Cellulosimicrobium cellulans TaxID=1710 RepID=UPI00209866C0|nr:PLP-dependent aminotransferase family protein [Cellulosimicrobium cellulans]MCO7275376.1 PLP-dependent aminotransferase family protein [Cellulosimicrobium cellulans]
MTATELVRGRAAGTGPAEPLTLSTLAAALTAPRGFGDQSLLSPRPDSIRLLGGIPDPGALPVDELRDALGEVWDAGGGVASLQYSGTQGLAGLREWIAEREGVDASRVVITSGGLHGLSLTVQALVERGATVAVDNPVFPIFLRVLELVDARTLPVPVEADGLDVAHLARRLAEGERVAAVYTVPDFHNPTQGTLSADKRAALVALAERYGFVVIADDPYRELRFAGVDQGRRTFFDSEHVVHVNTFTKTLGPGLRLGWLVLPESLVTPVVRLRNRQDSHSSTFVQTLVEHLLLSRAGWFDDTLARANALYEHRARVLVDELENQLPGAFEITAPEGGFFLWPRLVDDSVDTHELHRHATAEGVDYQQGEFFATGPGTDSARRLRLAYGDRTDAELRAAVGRLSVAYRAATRV